MDVALACLDDLESGGEDGAAQPDDSGLADFLPQDGRVGLLPVRHRFERFPFIQAVRLDDDASPLLPGRMADGVARDRRHGPGSRRVDATPARMPEAPEDISLEYFLSLGDHRFGFPAAMLQ